ncbi:hypothetical protein SIID45300_01328 [Candidatus Magnetaquicoccaceae bacterium FCR-1]|uniref:Glycosyltransferase (GlcNAc) n=1 Tax=Candidatus Magnetaquiglobus chichijimensis TaxID=3141448 RepID=A0ABQ0C803_9PROT
MDHVATATLFVSIASYRDSECAPTLVDLFAKARHPERVSVGVLWQILPDVDGPEFTAVPDAWRDQVRGRIVPVAESRGACWARSLIQTDLFGNEAYFLQIDSHTRFDPDWDVKLIRMLHACPSPKPVLSTHPNKYLPPDERLAKGLPHLRAKKFNRDGILIPQGEYLALDPKPEQPPPAAFIGAGMVFAKGSMVNEVPYDPYLYFHGEEITLSARLWTHGYDLFTPNDVILYHDYTERERNKHWDDHRGDWNRMHKNAVARLEHLLEVRPSTDPEVLREIERYGMGQVRTLDGYMAYADVDLRRRVIGTRGSDGHFPSHPPTFGIGVEIERIFTRIHAENTWGSRETRSGEGSELRATSELRARLEQTLARLGVRVLVDAGCGDLNWMAGVSKGLDLYLGYDVVEEMIRHNRTLHGDRANHLFGVAEICHTVLPRADGILCRNVLTHLPNDLVLKALRNFKRGESRHLLATTFPNAVNEETTLGHWHKVNLTAPPFALPEPILLIPDGKARHERFLGVWRLADW